MDAITLLRNDHKTVEQLFKRFEKAGDRAYVEKREIVDRIIEELSVHAAIEEQVFYPVARATVPDTEDIALESLEEHHIVKWLLSELVDLDPKNERFDAKVTVLIENVRHHVEEEQDEFFPKVRNELGRTALADLGQAMADAKSSAPTHPHPRAPDVPPGNAVVGAIAGVVDRVERQHQWSRPRRGDSGPGPGRTHHTQRQAQGVADRCDRGPQPGQEGPQRGVNGHRWCPADGPQRQVGRRQDRPHSSVGCQGDRDLCEEVGANHEVDRQTSGHDDRQDRQGGDEADGHDGQACRQEDRGLRQARSLTTTCLRRRRTATRRPSGKPVPVARDERVEPSPHGSDRTQAHRPTHRCPPRPGPEKGRDNCVVPLTHTVSGLDPERSRRRACLGEPEGREVDGLVGDDVDPRTASSNE